MMEMALIAKQFNTMPHRVWEDYTDTVLSPEERRKFDNAAMASIRIIDTAEKRYTEALMNKRQNVNITKRLKDKYEALNHG